MPDRASGWSLQIISADGAASAIVQEGQHPAHPPLGHGAPWLTFNQNIAKLSFGIRPIFHRFSIFPFIDAPFLFYLLMEFEE